MERELANLNEKRKIAKFKSLINLRSLNKISFLIFKKKKLQSTVARKL